jgi:hypothetical protein
MIFFPESPRHLMAIDREDEAMKVLRKLHYNGHNGDWLQSEFNEIKQTLAAEKAITVPGWRIMFTVPQWRTRLMHGVAVQAFTQLSGISMFITLKGSWYKLTTMFRCDRVLSSHYVRGIRLHGRKSNSHLWDL